MPGGRRRGQRHPGGPQGAHQPDRARIGVDPLGAQPLGEDRFLMGGDGLDLRTGRVEPPGTEERGGSVEA